MWVFLHTFREKSDPSLKIEIEIKFYLKSSKSLLPGTIDSITKATFKMKSQLEEVISVFLQIFTMKVQLL